MQTQLTIIMNDKYEYSMKMTNKGVMRLFEKIQDSLTAIDLSTNGFEGGIPEVLGDLSITRAIFHYYHNSRGPPTLHALI